MPSRGAALRSNSRIREPLTCAAQETALCPSLSTNHTLRSEPSSSYATFAACRDLMKSALTVFTSPERMAWTRGVIPDLSGPPLGTPVSTRILTISDSPSHSAFLGIGQHFDKLLDAWSTSAPKIYSQKRFRPGWRTALRRSPSSLPRSPAPTTPSPRSAVLDCPTVMRG